MPVLAAHSYTYRHRCLPDRIHSCLHEEYLLFSMLECQKSYNSSISHPVKYQLSDNSYSVFRLSSTADSQLASLSAARHFIFHISTAADFSLASLSAARKAPRYHPAPGQSSSIPYSSISLPRSSTICSLSSISFAFPFHRYGMTVTNLAFSERRR